MRVPLNLPQRLTAFTCTTDTRGRVLMVRHERLGVERWELPGGHVEPAETVADAAVRETLEETGVGVRTDRVVAECRHRWRGREVGVVYFHAERIIGFHGPPSTALPAGVRAVDWVDPDTLDPADTSALALPVLQHLRAGRIVRSRLLFEATHRETADGWEPVVVRTIPSVRHD